jgi:hypothetical protein
LGSIIVNPKCSVKSVRWKMFTVKKQRAQGKSKVIKRENINHREHRENRDEK